MEGWIKYHRQFMDHWLFNTKKPKTKREAWEDMLLIVNYEPKKYLMRGQLYECGRGQSLLSLNSWAKQFNWSIQQVRTFFGVLEKDGMIILEGLQYTTRLTICNYEYYQGEATDEQKTESAETPVNSGKQKTPLKTNKRNDQKVTQLTSSISKDKYVVSTDEQHTKQHTNNTPLTTTKERKEDKKKEEEEEEPVKKITVDQKTDFITEVISIFAYEYEKINQIPYEQISKGKERAAAGKLINLHKKRHPEMKSKEVLESLRIYFRACCSIQDDWLQSNMSLPIIISKFNEINNKLRNGNKRTKINSGGVTDIELATILANKFGSDRK